MRTHNSRHPMSNSLCVCGDPDCIYSYQSDRFDQHAKRLEAIEARERGEHPRKGYDLASIHGGFRGDVDDDPARDPRTVRLRR